MSSPETPSNFLQDQGVQTVRPGIYLATNNLPQPENQLRPSKVDEIGEDLASTLGFLIRNNRGVLNARLARVTEDPTLGSSSEISKRITGLDEIENNVQAMARELGKSAQVLVDYGSIIMDDTAEAALRPAIETLDKEAVEALITHFAEMQKAVGELLNEVRIQKGNYFISGPDEVNHKALNRLQEVMKLATSAKDIKEAHFGDEVSIEHLEPNLRRAIEKVLEAPHHSGDPDRNLDVLYHYNAAIDVVQRVVEALDKGAEASDEIADNLKVLIDLYFKQVEDAFPERHINYFDNVQGEDGTIVKRYQAEENIDTAGAAEFALMVVDRAVKLLRILQYQRQLLLDEAAVERKFDVDSEPGAAFG